MEKQNKYLAYQAYKDSGVEWLGDVPRYWTVGRLNGIASIKPVIPAWMLESSHRDVKLWASASAQSSICVATKLPSMALDSGIHAGMTVHRHLCIKMSTGRGNYGCCMGCVNE